LFVTGPEYHQKKSHRQYMDWHKKWGESTITKS
jgi:hypothetical protein